MTFMWKVFQWRCGSLRPLFINWDTDVVQRGVWMKKAHSVGFHGYATKGEAEQTAKYVTELFCWNPSVLRVECRGGVDKKEEHDAEVGKVTVLIADEIFVPA